MASKILTPRQSHLLALIGANKFFSKTFYLTGGTALAAFYLSHRYSEDLDFFTDSEIDALSLDIFFKGIKPKLKFRKIDYQQSYNRNLFFIALDSLLDLAVNKLFTIYQRTQARDYIDLYFICKEKGFIVGNLIAQAKIKFDWHIDPIQLGVQFMKAAEVKDYPRMIKKISPQKLQKFFWGEAQKLKPGIFV